jgi:hypothetical protein
MVQVGTWKASNIDWTEVDPLALDDSEVFAIFHARPLTAGRKLKSKNAIH